MALSPPPPRTRSEVKAAGVHAAIGFLFLWEENILKADCQAEVIQDKSCLPAVVQQPCAPPPSSPGAITA